jgi:hypothetical protein
MLLFSMENTSSLQFDYITQYRNITHVSECVNADIVESIEQGWNLFLFGP